MSEWAIIILILIGSFYMLVASIGLFRFPDLFTRMQATTKASSFALGCLLVAIIVRYQHPDVTIRALTAIFFIFITAPVGAHLLAKAAYHLKYRLWEGTILDELEEDLKKAEQPKSKKNTKATPQKKTGKEKISDIFKKLKDIDPKL